jgi:SAM-dependent methyltransferase
MTNAVLDSRTSPPLSFMAWLRFDLIRDAIDAVGLADGDRVLEIGPGQGAMGVRFADRFRYTGVEADKTSFETAALRLERFPHARVLHAERVEPAEIGRFHLVCAFEVLEHIEDDLAALRSWHALTRPGGHVLLSVPAHPHRFGPADTYVGHFRRYTREDLRRRLLDAGFDDVVVRTYGMPLGYALERVRNVLAARRSTPEEMEERTGASGRFLQPASAMGLAAWAGTLPFRMVQRAFEETDHGTGLVVRARKAT